VKNQTANDVRDWYKSRGDTDTHTHTDLLPSSHTGTEHAVDSLVQLQLLSAQPSGFGSRNIQR